MRLIRKLLRPLALTFAAVMLWASPANAAIINGTYSYWTLPTFSHYNVDGRIFVGNILDPATQPYWFASTQFGVTNPGHGGYIGLQQLVDQKKAIFSWWAATGASCSNVPGATCGAFGNEGSGYQTLIPYNWQVGRTYTTRVWSVGNDGVTQTWGGWIIDETTGVNTNVGYIRVPSSFGMITSAVNWLEWFGGHRPTCANIPQWVVYFHKLAGHGVNGYEYASYPPQNEIRTDGSCPATINNWGDPWVQHINPT